MTIEKSPTIPLIKSRENTQLGRIENDKLTRENNKNYPTQKRITRLRWYSNVQDRRVRISKNLLVHKRVIVPSNCV